VAATEAARLPGSALLAAALALPGVQPASADSAPDQRSVSFRYLDYLDRQPGRDRVRIKAPTVHALAPLGSDWSVSGSLVSDAISGASPAYHSSALTRLRDERQAGELSLTRYLADGTVSVGAGYSTEADYVSRGLTRAGQPDPATTATRPGMPAWPSAVMPSTRSPARSAASASAWPTCCSGSRACWARTTCCAWMPRPAAPGATCPTRTSSSTRGRASAAAPGCCCAGTTTCRRWTAPCGCIGAPSATTGACARTRWGSEWVQPWRWGLSLTPQLRLHTQSAARFYVDAQAGPSVPLPPPDALHSSFDHRLSAFGARTWGLKLAKTLGPEWTVDVKLEHYEQRAAWRIGGRGSPGLEPFQARSWQVGLTRVF
jgi:hypothetical protein